MATTTDAVYRAILARLQAATPLPVILDAAYIYVAAAPIFDAGHDQAVQLIPGPPTAIYPEAGHGLIREDFQVVGWSRLWSDEAHQSTDRITHATLGILLLMSNIRTRLMQFNDAAIIEPIRLVRGSAATESDEHPGWVMMADTYRVGYEIEWVLDT